MPSYKTHKKIGGIASLIFSLIFIILFYKKLPIEDWRTLLILPIVIIYSQLPDLDSYTSKIRKNTLKLIFYIMLFSGVLSLFISFELTIGLLMLTGLLGLGLLKVPHRGLLHTYWFNIIIALPLLYVHWFLFILGLLCSYSHIFVDRVFSRTKKKVKKLFGISNERRDYHFHLKW